MWEYYIQWPQINIVKRVCACKTEQGSHFEHYDVKKFKLFEIVVHYKVLTC